MPTQNRKPVSDAPVGSHSAAVGGPSLPASRAFVVQFRAIDLTAPGAGRVEHLLTGDTIRFASWDELRDTEEALEAAERRSPPARAAKGASNEDAHGH